MVCSAGVGFTLTWWSEKHNWHHVSTNLHESEPEKHDGDPDIDTLPFLAWSRKLARKLFKSGSMSDSAFAKFSVKYQNIMYFPLLCFARLAWGWQSITWAFNLDNTVWGDPNVAQVDARPKLLYPNGEKLALIVHYAWLAYLLIFTMPNVYTALAFFFLAQTLGGFLLALVFGVGHSGMIVYDSDKRPGFAEHQITTTRNIDPTPFNMWFMGGLEFQIEHHLFPMMPRHNLPKIADRVKALAKKYNVPYHCTSLWTGTVEVLSYLKEVASELQHGPM